jgi:hypothetical protein
VHELTESSIVQPHPLFPDGAIMTAEWLVTLSAVACLLMFVAVLFGGAYILAAAV